MYSDAYKNADGRKIDNRRVLVDVERSRTVKGWLSRRLGGGLGGTRRGGPDVNIKHSGREDDRRRGGGEEFDRERDRRDRSRERRRSRSRDRERDREVRRRRSRSRERKRRRSRERGADVVVDEEEMRPSRRHRSRSRERDRKHRRSRSPRERKHRRDRDRERKVVIDGIPGEVPVKIKQEPEDDYPEYASNPVYHNIPLKDEDRPKNGAPKFEQDEGNNEIDY